MEESNKKRRVRRKKSVQPPPVPPTPPRRRPLLSRICPCYGRKKQETQASLQRLEISIHGYQEQLRNTHEELLHLNRLSLSIMANADKLRQEKDALKKRVVELERELGELKNRFDQHL